MTLNQGVEIGPFSFSVIRILIAVGAVRAVMRGERLEGGVNRLDWMLIAFGALALTSSLFHQSFSEALIFRLGLAYNTCGVYFLVRIFCKSADDVRHLCKITAIILIPVAFEMLMEQVIVHNMFSALGGVSATPNIREGSVRSQGPFSHAILAGTVGAVCLPLMIGLWQKDRKIACAGIMACLVMAVTSSSSGPIMSCLAGAGAVMMWPFRDRMKWIRYIAILGYIALDIVMKAPAYYLMARISVVSGSTGWHRARLIQSAFEHLNEWWLGGTDYTRHWMPTGVSWNPDHTDITNYYLKMGVIGGLPLMIILIAIFIKAFFSLGTALNNQKDSPFEQRFFLWTLGAALFAHAATCISVSYFDQSFLFLYLNVAAIGSIVSVKATDNNYKRFQPRKIGIGRTESVVGQYRNGNLDIPMDEKNPPLSKKASLRLKSGNRMFRKPTRRR